MRIVAAILFIAGIHQAYNTRCALSKAKRASGVIVQKIEGRTSRGHLTYYPLVEYQPPGHPQRIRFQDKIGFRFPLWNVGDRVTVFYRENNVTEAIMDQGILNWLTTFVFFLFGFTILAREAWRKQKRKQNKESPL